MILLPTTKIRAGTVSARWKPLIAAVIWLALCAAIFPAQAQIRTLQQEEAPAAPLSTDLSELQLEPARRVELEGALKQRDYKQAEAILVAEAERDPKSPQAAKLLAIAGGIFFLDAQYLNSIIAWKKSEAIAPLGERNRFTLAMAYVKLDHRDWARPELEKLASAHADNPLY